MGPDAALIVCRFLHDVSAMLLWGAYAFLAALVPAELAFDVGRRLRFFRVVTIVVAVATTAAALPLETAMIAGGWSDALDPATVKAVLFETSVGGAWQVEAAFALLLALALAVPSRRPLAATALSAGLVTASFALSGHAVMHEGWLGLAHRVNDATHVLSAGAWLGALVPLLYILARLDEPTHRNDAALALRRFSTAGHFAVVIVIASGVINTTLVLGRWPTDWASPYQAMLAAKILVVVAMVLIASTNRYVFVPHMRRGSSAEAIRFGTAAELILGLVAIGLVSVFGMLEPT